MTLLGAAGHVKSFRHLHRRGHTDTSPADTQARPLWPVRSPRQHET